MRHDICSALAGVAVSLPEYARLREMQGKALKLDRMMKQLMQTMGPEKLKASMSIRAGLGSLDAAKDAPEIPL